MIIFAIVLAGGEGSRMGGADKALLELEGRPLISHVTARLAPQVARVLISANGDAARFAATGLQVLADEQPMGPLSGILSGLRAARAAGAAALLSVPVDAPFPPADLAEKLQTPWPEPAFARAGGRDHPATALWPVSLADPLAAFLTSGAKAKIADFAALHAARPVEFPRAEDFLNLNRPGDLAAAEALLRGGR